MSKEDKKTDTKKSKKTEIDLEPRLKEELSPQQRRVRGMIMRKNAAKIKAGRRRAEKRKPTKDDLEKRALIRAKRIIRDRLMMGKDKGYEDLSAAEKIVIDAKVKKKAKAIQRLAQKIKVQMRQESVEETRDVITEKRHHQMRGKDGSFKFDKRFRAFKKSKTDSEIDKDAESVAEDLRQLDIHIEAFLDEVSPEKLHETINTLSESAAETDLLESAFEELTGKTFSEHLAEHNELMLEFNLSKVAHHMKSQIDAGVSFDKALLSISNMTGIRPRLIQNEFDKLFKKEPTFDQETFDKLYKKYFAREECECEKEDEVQEKVEKKKTSKEKMMEAYLEERANENICDFITDAQLKHFEKGLDRIFDKFGIDFRFTTHFKERISDKRNKPCITLKELADTMRKVYKNSVKSLKGVAGAEGVIKDLQSDLNIPIGVKYDQKKDEFDVGLLTIMRKKNFFAKGKVIKVD